MQVGNEDKTCIAEVYRDTGIRYKMAEALLGIVIENLGSFVHDELATFLGVDQQIQKLSSYLTAIRAVLEDAEKKQITSNAVKDWLQKLTDAAYVLDDILDECSIHSKSSCLSRVHPKDILFRRDVGKRMKDITQRFHDIHEERSMFQFSTGVTDKQAEDDDEWRQTSSVITEPIIYGRDQDTEQIVESLLRHASNSQDLSIYTIVGMGGLGKTTLAKQVFNDDRVSKHFDLTIWVCVSNNFNMKTILQAIIEYTTGQNPNLNTLEAMRKKVQEVLQSKRYLLFLDDVWNEDQGKWKELKGVLQCAMGTILVTTRLEQVASIMEACHVHRLIELSDDDSWSLFKHHAFEHDREESEELVAIGKYIVRKCVGSPLAIKTLGSLLRVQSEVQQWQNIKESEIWDIKEESGFTSGENSILRALKLSYVNLDLSLRRCFSFCAIFPKDSEIVKEELIHLWMANGFIKSEGNLEVEDVGYKVWKTLYSRSFFQEAKSDEFGIITSFKMHDLFHDLAQSVVGEECVVYKPENLTHLSNKVHHLHLLECNESKAVNKASLYKVESLRTFLDDSYWFKRNVPMLPLNNSLRALKISSCQLPPLMDLTQLRYLNLHCSDVTCLPNSICRLQKLQVLKLEDCDDLYALPKDLTQLQDLRHLVIDRCFSIIVMPPNVGKLRHLRTLSSYIVGSKPGYGLAELHGLKLGGKLHIRGLENVPSEWDAKEANLISKRELNRLYLSWDGSPSSKGSNVDAELVLEGLEPPSTLKGFGMKGYKGVRLSRWMRNPSVLKDLVDVILYKCVNCKELPPLGKLAHLKKLIVYGMKDVKHIDSESYDGVEEKAFPSLEKFFVRDLPNLERILRDEGVEMLPRLSKLSIVGVPKLKLPSLPFIEDLYVGGIKDEASLMEEVVGNMVCLKILKIGDFYKLQELPDQLSRLGVLQELTISKCDELESFPEHVLQGLTSLRRLEVLWCKKLKWLCEGLGHLACLEVFHLWDCPEVVALPSNMNQLTALKEVSIVGPLPKGLECIPSLQRLRISDGECSSLPEWLGDMTSLRELLLWQCSELRSLPSSIQRLTNLSHLSIKDCPELEKRCKRETGQDWQYIAHIPQLDLGPSVEKKTCTFYGSERIQSFWTICNTFGIRSAIDLWPGDPPVDEFHAIIEDQCWWW
ncbi:putative disease resistance protein RGA4 isoform X2 [Cajanus cajan]|uniref:putative disease resistance protein RGA4 isoform X2 n=1 Tax=Cajanus cajan TaxID=3821 RepID=UPI0010FB7E8D|nr:putative disease resistance protein RGA4 isoform X2 [Cajanus cajan]